MMIYSSDIFDQSWPKLTGLYEEEEAKSLVMWLLEDLWGLSTTDILLNKKVSAEHSFTLDHYMLRLNQGTPVQHVLGYGWFMDRKYSVNSDVLIPRQETEELVHLVLNQNVGFSGSILDIGTGSGIIPISLKLGFPRAKVAGLDVSSKALAIAKKNAEKHKSDVEWIELDILKDVPNTRYDMLVSNPPYVLESEKVEMSPNVLGKDPDLALFVDNDDPLVFYRRICELSNIQLCPQGKIYFEIHEAYGEEVNQLMQKHQFENVRIHKDLNGKDRMASGIKKVV